MVQVSPTFPCSRGAVAGPHEGARKRPPLDWHRDRWYLIRKVGKGRTLLVAASILVFGVLVTSEPASAHAIRRKPTKVAAATAEPCVVRMQPGAFVEQGEMFGSSSVAGVVEVSCEPVYARAHLTVSANQLYVRCNRRLSWYLPYPGSNVASGSAVSVQLDNDGNAIVVLVGGPSCAAGESLVAAHMEAAPYTTATTAFAVLAPRDGPPGIRVSPESEVEGETYGDVATIVQVSFLPVFAEEPVIVNASELYSRCRRAPRLVWVTMGEEAGPEGSPASPVALPEAEETTVRLDDDGNAFAVLLGGGSCAAGSSLIEASLERAPYTTYTGSFTIEAPVPGLPGA